MIFDKENEKLTKSLLKKAMGYSVDEVVEEYIKDDEELKLVKKKITTKHIPPDISAARALLEKYYNSDFDEIRNLSDEELLKLREEILSEIKGGKKNVVTKEVVVTRGGRQTSSTGNRRRK